MCPKLTFCQSWLLADLLLVVLVLTASSAQALILQGLQSTISVPALGWVTRGLQCPQRYCLWDSAPPSTLF